MSVRAARTEDVARLTEIFRDSAWSNIDDRPLLQEHPEYLEWSGDPAREGRCWLAEVDGDIVGFVSTVDAGNEVDIEDLFVDPDHMRQGIATALLDDVVRRAGDTDLIVDANPHALAFYESAGFVPDPDATPRDGIALRRPA